MTPHFNLDELTRSDTATRLNIDNAPTEEALDNLKILAQGLENVRTKLDGNAIRISSGYRCLVLNRALRSKDTSQHIMGLAADFTCSGYGGVDDVMRTLVSSSIEYDQLILEFDRWIHISFPESGETARRHTFVIDRNGVKSYS